MCRTRRSQGDPKSRALPSDGGMRRMLSRTRRRAREAPPIYGRGGDPTCALARKRGHESLATAVCQPGCMAVHDPVDPGKQAMVHWHRTRQGHQRKECAARDVRHHGCHYKHSPWHGRSLLMTSFDKCTALFTGNRKPSASSLFQVQASKRRYKEQMIVNQEQHVLFKV
ncbi:hypothetical protein VTK73DRAFT_2176 [Phialemonium thermophilum]|uniref:Uncharacterized protein n=1 Tax=Phialemonium thermophilum TaxID=223376 RepID=A0ABR3VSH6_9PEZI